jgi:hypothetical protein
MRELRRTNEGSWMKDHCKQPRCKLNPWRGRLCYAHWRESQGWAFDRQQKIFVRVRSADTSLSVEPGNHRAEKLGRAHA